MPRLKDVFANLTDEQKQELLGELPAFIAGLSKEEREALDVKEPPAPEPKPKPKKPKSFFDLLDEWTGSK